MAFIPSGILMHPTVWPQYTNRRGVSQNRYYITVLCSQYVYEVLRQARLCVSMYLRLYLLSVCPLAYLNKRSATAEMDDRG